MLINTKDGLWAEGFVQAQMTSQPGTRAPSLMSWQI